MTAVNLLKTIPINSRGYPVELQYSVFIALNAVVCFLFVS